MKTGASNQRKLGREFASVALLLFAVLALLLIGVFLPNQTLFSNDGPLGRLMSQCHELPGRFSGCWDDLNFIGLDGGAAEPGITFGLQYLLKPVLFSKLYALLALLILGLGAWCFFVNLRLAPIACRLGGLAAALNSCFFSTACWGMAAHPITTGMTFFALAALVDVSSPARWLRVILAGMAVGMGVVEGADVGAIYSLYVAAFVIYQAWTESGPSLKKLAAGFSRVALVAVCAGLVAAPTIFSLVHTEIEGVVGAKQDAQTKETQWDWATQWSLPIRETTSLIVPGLFGYRMDTPAGGDYWGEIGRDPAIDKFIANGRQGEQPHGFMRYSGGGFYAGVLVALLAVWTIAQSLLRKNSCFGVAQRRWIWFWLAVAVISALFAYGRFAPLYRLLYALPYFSTIRNPVKFIYLVSFALVVIFAYGVDGLWRKYMPPAGPGTAPRWAGLKAWWTKAGKFERRWTYGCGVILGIVLVAWFKYADAHQDLVNYLRVVQFNATEAEAVASFSVRQVGWFVLFFVLSAGLMVFIFSGAFAGTKARWGGLALGLLLVADLGRANLPWVVYWNYPDKYATNAVIERLRERPYEHRVALMPGQWPPAVFNFSKLYRIGWLQQQFPYYNIQSLDVVNVSRMPEDLGAYLKALNPTALEPVIRLWQLTNTRYILGPADALDVLNHALPRSEPGFRIVERFNLTPKPGITNPEMVDQLTAVLDDQGAYALFEFTAALPRAKIFTHWQSNPTNQAVLEQLASPDFDPAENVFVADELPAAPAAAGPNPDAGNVDFTSYTSKDIQLKSDAPTPTVLMLNDRFNPGWKVLVDSQPRPLLRCNFIMRGVYLPAGTHTVEFQFRSPVKLLHFSLAAIIVGWLLLPLVIFLNRRTPGPT